MLSRSFDFIFISFLFICSDVKFEGGLKAEFEMGFATCGHKKPMCFYITEASVQETQSFWFGL